MFTNRFLLLLAGFFFLFYSCKDKKINVNAPVASADSIIWYQMLDWTIINDTRTDTISFDKAITLNGETDMLYFVGDVQDSEFENFEFSAELKTSQGGSGALWFHTSPSKSGYEVLVNNSYDNEDRRKTGSLSAIRNLYKSMAKDDEWFQLTVKVTGKQIEVRLDTMPVVRYVEPESPFRMRNYNLRTIGSGRKIALANYTGDVTWRNIKIAPLTDKTPLIDSLLVVQDEQQDSIIRFQQRNFPVIDYHVHLKGWNKEEAYTNSMKVGIPYAIAPNCGIGFPVTDDAGVFAYNDSTKHIPFFFAMQGEGREWPQTFSDSARRIFDFVFTDAMTFTDHKDRRTRLWIPEETFVDISQEKYMDIIVQKILDVLNNEPIDVYVNPTFLPDVMLEHYDKLWTAPRIKKVVDALVKNDIALEINARYRIPNAAIIKAAKKAGVKFTFGTNNGDPDIGRLEYCIKMVHECGLTSEDMWFPKVVK